jgi:hypothetical protein
MKHGMAMIFQTLLWRHMHSELVSIYDKIRVLVSPIYMLLTLSEFSNIEKFAYYI